MQKITSEEFSIPMVDSVLVLEAVSMIDTSLLLPLEKNKLEEFARENEMQISFDSGIIKFRKYQHLMDSPAIINKTSKDLWQQKRELSKMTYIGKVPRRLSGLEILAIVILGNGLVLLIGYLLVLAIVTAMVEAVFESCYIATACYGDYNSREVVVLRRFRDRVLKNYLLGRLFIGIYYTISPPLAKYLRNQKALNNLVRVIFLDPLVKLIQNRI